MKMMEQVIESLEAQLIGTRKLLAELRAERIQREQAAKPAEISDDKQVETA
jgi:hypothetical protein